MSYQEERLHEIADAIRTKTSTTNEIKATEFAQKILDIPTGTELPTLTNQGNDGDILNSKQFIDQDGNIVTGTMPTVEQVTLSIMVSSSGLITASGTQSAGYVAAGTKSATKQLTTQAAKTITPSTTEQVAVTAGTYVIGDIKVAAVSEGGGSSEQANAIVSRTITGYTNESITEIGAYAFRACKSLAKVDLGAVGTINNYSFAECTALTALIIRTSSVCALTNTDAFTNGLIAQGTGYIYVPSALVASYKTATNWSVFVDQIRAIEDYPEITGGGGADGYTIISGLSLSSSDTVDLGFTFNSTDYIYIDCMPTVTSFYGNFVAAGSSSIMRFRLEATNIYAKINWYNQSFATLEADTRYVMAMNGQNIYYNGEQVIRMSTVPAFTTDTNGVLGGVSMVLYEFRYGTSSDDITVKYVPAKRNSDSVVGLYDEDNDKFIEIGTEVAD